MFGRRSDGKAVKNMDIIERLTSHFMPDRNDAMNMIMNEIHCENIDKFIAQKREEGFRYTYMDIINASIVRILAMRPMLNRFVMRGKVYQRKGIFISLSVKKTLKDEGESTEVKVEFTGKETLEEVTKKFEEEIKKCTNEANSTEKVATLFNKTPNFLLRWVMGLLRFMDKRGMLPKSLIKASPFHTSVFLTNLKSIKCDAIFHHVYNFGTTGMFISMGKEKMQPLVDKDGKLYVGKIMKLGITMDERFCDGFYFARSLRLFTKYIENPELLEKPFTEEDIVNK